MNSLFTLYFTLTFVYVTNEIDLPSINEQWAKFKTKFGKTYSTAAEENLRRSVYVRNLKTIEAHNRLYALGRESFLMGTNKFADLLPEEFVSLMTMSARIDSPVLPSYSEDYANSVRSSNSSPESVDWRKRGAVTPVKDQGECGACYAFAVAGCMESHIAIRDNESPQNASVQDVMDCSNKKNDPKSRNDGCNGGMLPDTMIFVTNRSINTAEHYQWEGKEGKCRHNSSKPRMEKVSGVGRVRRYNETALQSVIRTRPAAAAVDATGWQFYRSGIYKGQTSRLNHAILVVGYANFAQDQNYWILKNSWGKSWGEKGYMRMAKGLSPTAVASDAYCFIR